jgi:hypothetical protein
MLHYVKMKKQRANYKKAYNILIDYWDSLPEEEKPYIDKELKKVGC